MRVFFFRFLVISVCNFIFTNLMSSVSPQTRKFVMSNATRARDLFHLSSLFSYHPLVSTLDPLLFSHLPLQAAAASSIAQVAARRIKDNPLRRRRFARIDDASATTMKGGRYCIDDGGGEEGRTLASK